MMSLYKTPSNKGDKRRRPSIRFEGNEKRERSEEG